MKLTVFLLTAFLLQVKAVTFAQKITFSGKNVALTEVFKVIRQQSGYDFVYTTQQIKLAKKVSVDFQSASLREILDKCFENQPLTYSISEKTVIVKPKSEETKTFPSFTNPFQIIRGTVIDKNGRPLSNVNIYLLGTSTVVVSNDLGQFSINANSGSKLRAVLTGYQQLDINITDQLSLNITLQELDMNLSDIVVVGYGQTKRENLTTSVTTISADQITQMPVTNLSQVFAGRLPGILSRSSSGVPGGDQASLLIRTTNGAEAPLLVIDGVPRFATNSTSGQVGLSDIDPNEVESISILKDNAATAVYGARGANGVIIVTTKRGKNTKPAFSYAGNYTFSSPGKMITNLDSYGYAIAQNEYFVNSGLAAPYSSSVLDIIKNQSNPYVYANTDWVKLLTERQAFVQNHSLNLTGGTEAVKYFISGSYADQGGMYRISNYKRYSLQNNLDVTINKNFKAQVNLGFRNSTQTTPSGGDPMNSAINASPLAPARNENGSYGSAPSGGAINPLAAISEEAGYAKNTVNYLTANGKLTYQPTYFSGFSAYTNFYVEKGFTRGKTYVVPVPLYRVDPTTPTGYLQTGGAGLPSVADATSDQNTYSTDVALNYQKTFGKHSIDFLALYNVSENSSNSNSDRRLNLVAPGLDILNLGSTIGETTSGTRNQFARQGVVGKLDYDFDKKILLQASFRLDGSTRFAPGHRWGFFPGGSAAWVISKEDFFKPFNTTISSLKIRASYGLTGDDNVGVNTYYYTYRIANTGTSNTYGYMFGTTFAPTFVLNNSTLPNENITWAKNRQVNFGLDASLWNGRLGVTFDVYQKDRYDILMSQTYNLPSTFGINGPIQNFAKLRNKGFDVELSSQNHLNEDWTIGANFNFTYVKTTILDYGTKDLPEYQRTEGYSTNTQVGYDAVGIFQNAGEIAGWFDQDGLKNATIKPGDIKYADRDGDGKLTPADQIRINNYGFPPINFGFGFNVNYKNFSLSTFFNGALNGYIKYAQALNWQFTYDNAWRPGNEAAIYPRLASSANNSLSSNATLIKDDFLRLRDLRLGYSLPIRWIKAVNIKSVKVFAEATNLITWTTVLGGIDPETPNLGSQGASGGFYPNQKNIGFGLNVNF